MVTGVFVNSLHLVRHAGRSFFIRDHQIYMWPISFARMQLPDTLLVGRKKNEETTNDVAHSPENTLFIIDERKRT